MEASARGETNKQQKQTGALRHVSHSLPHRQETLSRLLQIGVTVQSAAVVAEELLAFLQRNLTLLDALRHPYLKLPDELLGIVLYVFEHFLHRLAVEIWSM